MLFGFLLKHYVRVTRVCSNCGKTTSQSQRKTEKSVIFITNLQYLSIIDSNKGHYVTAWWCNYPSTEHWHSWVISFIFDIRTALKSLDLSWVETFSSLTLSEDDSTNVIKRQGSEPFQSSLSEGWAHLKPKGCAVGFSEKVRQYLTSKFEIGEQSVRKLPVNGK